MKKALITGITGQDGSYLAELLLEKGYEVHGIIRRSSSFNRSRIEPFYLYGNDKALNYAEHLKLHYGDLTDSSSLNRIISKIRPDEIYNLAAQSHVGISFDIPEYTAEVTGVGTVRLLDTIREVELQTRFYQASSSELFGKVVETPQNENTPFRPRSPYACAKAYAYYITENYREAYNMFACNGILFNHESPRRGENFVSRKITLSLARIKYELQHTLHLGNLNAKRDWGYAKDYVNCMWLMLQQKEPDSYVVATGKTHSVREFCELAAKKIDMEIVWEGSGLNEKGIDRKTGRIIIEVDKNYFRPSEVDLLLGDPTKVKNKLGWDPNITTFESLVDMMMESDLKQVAIEKKIRS